jgi:hypothetical protein
MSAGFGQFLVAAFAIATQNWWLLASTLAGVVASDREAEKARRRAIQQQNAAARDRLVMVDLQPNAPRTLVMGRVRYVEGVRDVWTSGVFDENMTMVVSFAGHEIDGFEQWYLDDKLVTLDGSGWVNEAPYRRTDNEARTVNGVLDGAGNATIALAEPPAAGTDVLAVWSTGSGENQIQGSAAVSVVGSTATVTGGQPLAGVQVIYFTGVLKKFVRIRPYVGAAGQNVGADLAAEYPGKVTATDRFAGMALAVIDVLYEPDVFPQGRPNVSAVLRGAKMYDPRTGATVFSENLALMALHYFTYAYGWARSSALARAADIVVAANVCDTITAFVLRKPDGSTGTVTRALFHGGITIPDDADKPAAMASLVDAMAGRAGWSGGQWRLRAGVLGASVATITQDWLVNNNTGGRPDDEPVISAVQSVPRTSRINRVSGRCTDPDQRYQLLPFPAVQDPVLVAAKGERLAEVEWQAVNHIAHAQHLASMMIRRAQAGLQLELTCGEQAADLELLDVVELTMPDYGYSAKPFEVVGITWNPTGAYKLTLLETAAELYTVDAELRGRDPAPDSNLREPWDVETMAAPTVTSGTTPTLDGSIITRTVLAFAPAVGQNIRRGGQIEIQYTEAAATLPTGDWPSWVEQGDAAKATIPGLLQGRFYFFRIRAVQTLPLVRGKWSPVRLHQVAAVARDALQADLDAAAAAAAAAASAASTAQAGANTANAALADIASDSFLTADEKPRVIQDRDVIVAEQAGIGAQATNYAVTTEKATYETAVSALTTYLATLTTPVAWDNLSGKTTIVGATFRAKFADVYTTRQALLDKINDNAKARLGALATLSSVNTAQIAAGAATGLIHNAVADLTVTRNPPPGPGIFVPNFFAFVEESWVNATGETMLVEVSIDIGGQRTAGDAACYLSCFAGVSTPPTSESDADQLVAMTNVSSSFERRVLLQVVSVPNGSTVYARGAVLITVPAVTTTVRGRECSVRITVIKR